MYGIDLTKEIKYQSSSLRFFAEQEYHIDRFSKDDVLILVYDGVLRFYEDGVFYEIHPGEYHIQKHNSFQKGIVPSDAPKYLYVHFHAAWTENSPLPKSGTFDYLSLKSDIEEMNALSYNNAPYIIKTAKFYDILIKLCQPNTVNTVALQIADFIKENYNHNINLDTLCKKFSFSKNHIINMFKKEFGQTPVTYLNNMRLNKAEQLLITTSESTESISLFCGYRHYSYFYRQFIRKNQTSPEKFRQKKRLGE